MGWHVFTLGRTDYSAGPYTTFRKPAGISKLNSRARLIQSTYIWLLGSIQKWVLWYPDHPKMPWGAALPSAEESRITKTLYPISIPEGRPISDMMSWLIGVVIRSMLSWLSIRLPLNSPPLASISQKFA